MIKISQDHRRHHQCHGRLKGEIEMKTQTATTRTTTARKTKAPAAKTQGSKAQGVDATRAATEDALVREHLPLVGYVVSEIAHRIPSHVSRSDLVSAGMLGLAQAARSFDPERGIAFDRFASTRIRGALLDELRGRDWASRSVRARARAMAQAGEDLTAKLGRAPSNDEIADVLQVEPEVVHKLVEDVHRATVLNYESLVLEGDAESFLAGDVESPEEAIVGRERRAFLTDAVSSLPERLRRVVIGYFFEERSMQDLADELGVSESRVSQLRAEALLLLKDGINSQLDPEQVEEDARPNGRVARRKAAYYAQIATSSTYRARLDGDPESIHDKAARIDRAREQVAM
jgi:RNA polymerase sigma factor for flagellar operon FliA